METVAEVVNAFCPTGQGGGIDPTCGGNSETPSVSAVKHGGAGDTVLDLGNGYNINLMVKPKEAEFTETLKELSNDASSMWQAKGIVTKDGKFYAWTTGSTNHERVAIALKIPDGEWMALRFRYDKNNNAVIGRAERGYAAFDNQDKIERHIDKMPYLVRVDNSHMETLVANLGAARRVVDSHGTWLVAPMTLIVPGVLDGSKGPLYYPADEVARNYKQWEGYPLTRNHPVRNGSPASAFDDGVLDKVGMGVVRNPAIVDNKLVAEGWFHETRTKQVDENIWNALVEGRQIELSTGLGTENEVRNGRCPVTKRGYTAIARNYKPDHVAILTDGQRGACSINDGCGVHNVGWMDWITNALGIKSITTGRFKPTGSGTGKGEVHEAAQAGALTFTDYDRELGATVRNDLSVIADEATWQRAKDAAGKSYNEDDDAHWSAAAAIYQRMGGVVRNAFCATGEGGGQDNSCGSSTEQLKAIKGLDRAGLMAKSHEDIDKVLDSLKTMTKDQVHAAIAEVYGQERADTYKTLAKGSKTKMIDEVRRTIKELKESAHFNETRNQSEEVMNRDQAINHLTTNCDCWKGKKELLSNATHFTDDDINKLITNFQAGQLAVNSLKEIGQAVGAPATLTINAMPAFVKEKVAAAPAAEKCAECGATKVGGKCPDCEAAPVEPVVGNKKRTTEQWLADAPPEAREMLNGLIANERSAKSELIGKLVANAKPGTKERLQKSLATKPVSELRDLVSLLPTNNRQHQDDDVLTSYFGAAGGSNDIITDNSSGQTDGVEYNGPWPGVIRMGAKTA